MWVDTPAGVLACVAGQYEGTLRSLLVAFKHAGQIGFARELGQRLNAPIRLALSLSRGPTLPLLVTVPSRPARVRARGYRHVDVLVRAALRYASVAPTTSTAHAQRPWLVPRALRARRGRTAQVGLSASERQRNAALVEVTPAARSVLRGREVVLIDDVVTTGATVAAARGALTDAGAQVIAIVALCAVERRTDRLGTRPTDSTSESRSGRHSVGPSDLLGAHRQQTLRYAYRITRRTTTGWKPSGEPE